MAEETVRARTIRMRTKIGKTRPGGKGGSKVAKLTPMPKGLEDMPKMKAAVNKAASSLGRAPGTRSAKMPKISPPPGGPLPNKTSAPAIDAINKRPPEWGGGLEKMPQIQTKGSAPAIEARNKRAPEWSRAAAAPASKEAATSKLTGRANAITRGLGKKTGLKRQLADSSKTASISAGAGRKSVKIERKIKDKSALNKVIKARSRRRKPGRKLM